MRERRYYVYILASAARVLYTGMTNSLDRRMWQHENKEFDGFTVKFRFCRLVYFESFDDVRKAIDREKQIKRWRREKKVWLIESLNPDWKDLRVARVKEQGMAPRLPRYAGSLGVTAEAEAGR
jgi:putative endonuclease